METTEKIVEAYVRYVKRWATIPNIGCGGQKEIDLLAIDPVTNERYHIETSVSISSGFSKLTTKAFATGDHKNRVKAATARRTLGFFVEEKFEPQSVACALKKLGCDPRTVYRVIVTWDATPEAEQEAASRGIAVWKFPELMSQIADEAAKGNAYFSDDTLRTPMLFARGLKADEKKGSRSKFVR
jgi:hypothetical protein